MFKSDIIKKICYFIFGFACVGAFILFVGGLILAADGEILGLGVMLAGVILPFIATISMYPIFALANIAESMGEINYKIGVLVSLQGEKGEDKIAQIKEETENKPAQPKVAVPQAQQKNAPIKLTKEMVAYINKKYNANIVFGDDEETIRRKIAEAKQSSENKSE